MEFVWSLVLVIWCLAPKQRPRSLRQLQPEEESYPQEHVAHENFEMEREVRPSGTLVLKAGDGSGITSERVLSLTANAPTELLIIDLATRGARDSTA